MNKFTIWIKQIRANYLVLAILLVSIGVALAYKYKPAEYNIALLDILLVYLGVIFAHISINLINEYTDYESGIDNIDIKSPFSGGENLIRKGFTKYTSVLFAAFLSLIIAATIGVYFVLTSHLVILVLLLIGLIAIAGHTDVWSKYMINEVFSGIILGTVVIIGTYIALIHQKYVPLKDLIPIEVWVISIPPGLLTTLLLILNKFPSDEKNKIAGRKPLVAVFGRQKASQIYSLGALLTFILILVLN